MRGIAPLTVAILGALASIAGGFYGGVLWHRHVMLAWEESLQPIRAGHATEVLFPNAAGLFVVHAQYPLDKEPPPREVLAALRESCALQVRSAQTGRPLERVASGVVAQSEYVRGSGYGVGLAAFEAAWGGPFEVTFSTGGGKADDAVFVLGPHVQQAAGRATLGFAGAIITALVCAGAALALGFRSAINAGLIKTD